MEYTYLPYTLEHSNAGVRITPLSHLVIRSLLRLRPICESSHADWIRRHK